MSEPNMNEFFEQLKREGYFEKNKKPTKPDEDEERRRKTMTAAVIAATS